MSFSSTLNFSKIICCKCSAPFLILEDRIEQLRESHASFWCPYCACRQHFVGKSEKEKLQEQLTRVKEQRDAAERSAAAQRGAKTRILNRIKNGVCPCCSRYFSNLHQHILTKHAEEVRLETIRNAQGLTQKILAKLIGVHPAYISLYERDKPVPEKAQSKIEAAILKFKTGGIE